MATDLGGRGRIEVRVTAEEIGARDAEGFASASDGAVVTFLGVVRDSTEGKPVSALSYEAYEEMARKQMREIADEARRRWKVGSVLMVHRTGELKIGEVSVVVAVAAPHRGEAFDACEFCIDALKTTAAIWKKEMFSDGTSAWVNHP
jgi:molybdopterin synthase catalytic subunit